MDKDRIKQRLDALGITQFEAGLRAGWNENFLYDFMTGRKKAIKGEGPARIAYALQCSIEFLEGKSDEIGDPPLGGGSSLLPLIGFAEAGIFRKTSTPLTYPDRTPVPPHPNFSADAQFSVLMRDNSLQKLGVTEGMFLSVVAHEAVGATLQNGMIVLVEHRRLGDTEAELSAREIQHYSDRIELLTKPLTGDPSTIIVRDGKTDEPDGTVTIRGIVISATRYLAK